MLFRLILDVGMRLKLNQWIIRGNDDDSVLLQESGTLNRSSVFDLDSVATSVTPDRRLPSFGSFRSSPSPVLASRSNR